MNARVKNMKRQLDESEEEVTRLNTQKRKLQRDFDENQESLESSQREVNQLRQRLKYVKILVLSYLGIVAKFRL